MNNQPIKHAIVNHPSIQAQLYIYDTGPYSSVQMNEDNNFYYVVGKDGINTLSLPDSQFRTVWERDIANILVSDLNQKFPVDTAQTV